MMAFDVYLFWIIRADKATAFNSIIRAQFDFSLDDSLTVPLWIANPGVGSPDWYWQGESMSLQRRDDQLAAMAALGQLNHGGPPTQGAYYASDEAQTGASKTTAPVGGWTASLARGHVQEARCAADRSGSGGVTDALHEEEKEAE